MKVESKTKIERNSIVNAKTKQLLYFQNTKYNNCRLMSDIQVITHIH